jgi:pimeloyl-ACP methyl ester carboxylesterase
MFKYGGGAYGTGYFDLRPTLKKVLCPSLVIYPDRSSIFDVEQGVSFYKHLERGELAVLPSCGHNTYEYLPADYVRISLEFLKRHNPKIKPLKQTDILQGLSCLAVREKEEG